MPFIPLHKSDGTATGRFCFGRPLLSSNFDLLAYISPSACKNSVFSSLQKKGLVSLKVVVFSAEVVPTECFRFTTGRVSVAVFMQSSGNEAFLLIFAFSKGLVPPLLLRIINPVGAEPTTERLSPEILFRHKYFTQKHNIILFISLNFNITVTADIIPTKVNFRHGRLPFVMMVMTLLTIIFAFYIIVLLFIFQLFSLSL